MSPTALDPPYDRFLATAEAVAQERPEVDLEMAREVFLEVATMLYNGLALDGLDDHDAQAVVDGLCVDLVSKDPGAAVRTRSVTTLEGSWGSARSRERVRVLPGRREDPAALTALGGDVRPQT